MPSRVVRGEILSSDSLSRVSRDAEALFWRLLIAADDFGRLDGRIGVLRSVVWPAREDVCSGEIERWLSELATCDPGGSGPIVRYEVHGRPYLQLRSWEEHRGSSKRADKSRFPGIPADPLGAPRIPADPRPSDDWRLASDEGRVTSEREPEPERPKRPTAEPVPPAAIPQAEPEPERPEVPGEHRKALNLIAKEPGSPREKELWLIHELPLMAAEVEAGHGTWSTLILRWYRAYQRRPPTQGIAGPERQFQRAERQEREDAVRARWHAEHPPPTPEQLAADAAAARVVDPLFARLELDEEMKSLGRSDRDRRRDRPSAN